MTNIVRVMVMVMVMVMGNITGSIVNTRSGSKSRPFEIPWLCTSQLQHMSAESFQIESLTQPPQTERGVICGTCTTAAAKDSSINAGFEF